MTLQKISGKETENECLPDFLVGGKEMAVVAACTCTNTSSKHLPEGATLVITIIIIATSIFCIIRLVTTNLGVTLKQPL